MLKDISKSTVNEIKVTIIVPTYKRGMDMLFRSVNSLLNQTHECIEIILVDDNYDNKEARIITKEFFDSISDERLKIIFNDRNLGGGLSRNVGILAATGKYVTFLDDDDKYERDKILEQVTFMENNKYEMSFSNMLILDSNEKVVNFKRYELLNFDKETLRKYHLIHQITGTPTFMYELTSLIKIGMFDNVSSGQEYYLMMKTIEQNLKIGYLDRCDVVVYAHEGERISNGTNKLIGANEVYDYKRERWNDISILDKQYVRFRHFLVVSHTYKKAGNYFRSVLYLIISFINQPVSFLQMGCDVLNVRIRGEKVYAKNQ